MRDRCDGVRVFLQEHTVPQVERCHELTVRKVSLGIPRCRLGHLAHSARKSPAKITDVFEIPCSSAHEHGADFLALLARENETRSVLGRVFLKGFRRMERAAIARDVSHNLYLGVPHEANHVARAPMRDGAGVPHDAVAGI